MDLMDTIYTESIGTTCYIDGERGTVTGLHTHPAHGVLGAFVRSDERDVMLFVQLGGKAGERGSWREVTGSQVITRDDFDRITTLDALRRDMGWAA